MSKELAIKGHPTRGNEVVELIGMLCGQHSYTDNICTAKCNIKTDCYYMCDYGFISWSYLGPDEIDNFKVFTLEEFLEKYPFKIGDRVLIPEYESEVRICKMRWDSLCEYVEYMVYRNDDPEWYTAEELLNYNDNPTPCLDGVYSISTCKTTGQGTSVIKIADGYRFDSIDENGNIIVKAIKPKYPTTYDECCEVIGINRHNVEIDLPQPYQQKMFNLFKLRICRDAYWKIAGEQMGLGEPWEPDWRYINRKFYCIYNSKNNIVKNVIYSENKILAFPTEELRDIFYENFKDLIEQCKELL